jgi:3-oxoacyl-[acyl-carrier protein] reductase
LIDAFSAAGHRLSVLVRRGDAIPALRDRYPDALFHVGDVSLRKDADAWLGQTVRAFGRIDTLVNNAAITGPGGKLHELDFDEFEKAVRTDLLAPIYLCQKVIPSLLETKGTVINLSGGGATGPRPYFTAYAASKCALVRVTETLALEYPELRFFAISPGILNTGMMLDVMALGAEKVGKEFEAARHCTEGGGEDPRKAADLAVWLAKHRPEKLNGKLISAIWDNYQNPPAYPSKVGWWTLRRVDEMCYKSISELPQ